MFLKLKEVNMVGKSLQILSIILMIMGIAISLLIGIGNIVKFADTTTDYVVSAIIIVFGTLGSILLNLLLRGIGYWFINEQNKAKDN